MRYTSTLTTEWSDVQAWQVPIAMDKANDIPGGKCANQQPTLPIAAGLPCHVQCDISTI